MGCGCKKRTQPVQKEKPQDTSKKKEEEKK